MNKVMSVKKSPDEALKDYLKYLLENELVSGVLTLTQSNKNDILNYAFITAAGDIQTTDPLAPVMPENGAAILSSLTPTKKKIAAVLRPCEQRAFIERVKRSQGSMENVILISYTCGGVYPLKTFIQSDQDKLLVDHNKSMSEKKIPEQLRPTCKACEYFSPLQSDITISLIGVQNLNSECIFYLNSDTAIEITKKYSGEVTDGDFDSSKLEDYKQLRQEAKSALFSSVVSKQDGLNELVDVFGRCVGCHGCSRVCPICYCVLCDFESSNFDYDTSIFKAELARKGGLRLPPDTLFFQLGRLTHMSFSCIGCGQCTDVCPADIPVSAIFMKTGEQVAGLFDYVPGRELKEEIPVMVFKEEEFSELGE